MTVHGRGAPAGVATVRRVAAPAGARRRAPLAVVAAVAATAVLGACRASTDGSAPGSTATTTGGAPTSAVTRRTDPAAPTRPPAAITEPTGDWTTADPRAEGFDPTVLADVAARAKAADSDCFAVVRHGRMVAQSYWKGSAPSTAHEVFSATKSLTSTLVGIAVDHHQLALSDEASQYLPQWRGTAAAGITIRDLVSMVSGRHWDFRTDYVDLAVRARDKDAFSIALPQDVAPGTRWVYNNAAVQTLSAILTRATGEEPATYAQRMLFAPTGMRTASISSDLAGHTLTFMGWHASCGDVARLGELALRHGSWNGTQVVSAGWLAQATGRPSTDLNASYGYLWWLNRKGKVAGANVATGTRKKIGGRQMVPGAPDDLYWALGLGNQIIQVDPGSDTVVVRIGPGVEPGGTPGFGVADTAEVVTKGLRQR